MKTRVYKYEVQTTKKGDRKYTKYKFTFVIEFDWFTCGEWLDKMKLYAKDIGTNHAVDMEPDGQFCVYLRKKRYTLDKGVNVI